MRFITVSAAILVGSALSGAQAQQPSAAAKQGVSAKQLPVSKSAINQANPSNNGGGSVFVVSGGSDTCATATPIAGAGTFAGDTAAVPAATPDGAGLGFGWCGNTPANDVWYDWTAAATGATFMSLCAADGGVASFDTVLAAYNTASCVGTPALVCNDDFCAPRSRISFAATAGNVYKVRLAGWSGATGTYSLVVGAPPPPPANDMCASAIPIAGPGVFVGNNISSSLDGTVAPCSFGANDNDVWYDWTATFTAPTTVSTCPTAGGGAGTASFDTVIRITATAACPQGAEVACDDDFCGSPSWRSATTFPASSGSVYKIQLMGYSASGEGTYSMEITAAPPGPANDFCASATPYAGGVVPWTNVGATTDGPAAGCGNLQQDIWYTWTSPCTGTATFSLCPGGELTPDTVADVWEGTACPPTSQLGCDDDTCSSPAFGTSQVTWCVTTGSDYLLRIGGFGVGTTGSGFFEVTACGPNPTPQGTCIVLHDGMTENAIGTNNPTHDILWMHSMGVSGASTVVKSISTAWGTTATPPNGPPNFAPARVGIWSDPNEDGNPSDAVLIQEIPIAVSGSDTDALQNVPLAPPVLVTGKYFVGASCQNGTFPAPLDQGSFDPCNSTAWIVGEVSGSPLDYNNLAGAAIPPTEINGLGFPGFWLLEAECKDLDIDEICGVAADSTLECPCFPPGSTSTIGNGCPHSGNAGGSEGLAGAHLGGSGVALIGAGDTVSLSATNVRQGNGSISLLLQGDNDPQIPFNDGLICSSNNILKLWSWKDPVGPAGSGGGITSQSGPGASTIPPTTSISQRSSDLGSPILNGQTRVYTMVFRDPAPAQGCPGLSTVNTTNGVRVLWSQL